MLNVPQDDDDRESASSATKTGQAGRRLTRTRSRSRRGSLTEEMGPSAARQHEVEMFRASLIGREGSSAADGAENSEAGAESAGGHAAVPARTRSTQLVGYDEAAAAAADDDRHETRSSRARPKRLSHAHAAGRDRLEMVTVDEVATTHSRHTPSAAATSQSHYGSHQQHRAGAAAIDNQLFGTATIVSSVQHSHNLVRRVADDGAVTFVRVQDATCRERIVHWFERARVSLTARMFPVLAYIVAFAVVSNLVVMRFELNNDYHDAVRFVLIRQTNAVRRCAAAVITEAANVAAATAAGVLDNAVLSQSASAAECDFPMHQALAMSSPSDHSSSYALYRFPKDSDAEVAAAGPALAAFNASFVNFKIALRQLLGASSVSEARVHNIANASIAVVAALAQVAGARQGRPSTAAFGRLVSQCAVDLSISRNVAGAAVYGGFADMPAMNASAVDPDWQSATAGDASAMPVRTAYVEYVRRLAATPLAFRYVHGAPFPQAASLPAVSGAVASFTGLGDLIALSDTAAIAVVQTRVTMAALLNGSTASGRTAQVAGWATQLLLWPLNTDDVQLEWKSTITLYSCIAAIFAAACFGLFVALQFAQRAATKGLERQLEQRAVLQQSVAAFVPRAFLALMGYEDINSIRPGDHRTVMLSMIFFSVHNYAYLGAGNRVDRMFRFQQNLMSTCVSVSRDNDGFIDKFLGDGAFLLFSHGLDAVIAAAELYSESQDLAVRPKITAHKSMASSRSSHRSSNRRDEATASQSSLRRRASATSTAKSGRHRDKDKASNVDNIPLVESDNDSIDDDELADSQAPSHVDGGRSHHVVLRRRGGRRGAIDHMEASANSESSASRPRSQIAEEDRVRMGVGVHTGEVCVGILGDAQRHSCTLVSSKVNLASRLCKLTQKLKVGILISQDTYESCGQQIEEEVGHYLRRFGSTKVYGQKIATEVLELFACDEPEVREYKLNTAGKWREAQDLQTYMRYDEAAALFNEIKAEGDATIASEAMGVDGKKFVDVPLELNRRLRAKHHVFLEK